jgi:hypothetical protein
VPAASLRTRVRADAAIRIRQPRPLRGTVKLAQLGPHLISERADLVTMDLSYLPILGAKGAVEILLHAASGWPSPAGS